MGKNSSKKEVVKDKGQRIDISLTDRARAKSQRQSNPFILPTPFPGVVPPNAPTMAQDDGWGNISAYTSAVSGDFGYGNGFFGYAYLADLAQRPEYRRMSEILAKEMTRKWIKFRATGDDAESKLDKIAKLEDAFRKYQVQDAFRRVAELDGFFGRAHLFIDTGASDDLLKTPLVLRPQTVKKGMLKSIRVVEPIWAYPDQYNSTQPLAPHYYKPQNWYVMSQGVHVTRLLTFVSREVPDILKPAYQFGGLSMSQMAYPYVENWLRARQSVSDLMHAFSVSGIKTNLQAPLSSAGGPSVLDRAQFFNDTRDNRGFMVLDKDSEDFFNITTPLSTLDKLQAQAQEQMSSVSGIPLVKLLGITPTGLNASSDGEIRVLYDYIEALQEQLFTKNLTSIMHVIMLSEFGEIDEEIVFTYEPLWTMSAQERAVIRKTDTDNGIELINAGVITPMEERTRQANSEDTLYPSLDLSIDPAEQMMTDEDTQIMPDPAKSRAAEARQENLFERTDAENV